MKVPFTVTQFFEVFKNYNEAIFPLQILIYLGGLIALYLAVRPNTKSNQIISAILAGY